MKFKEMRKKQGDHFKNLFNFPQTPFDLHMVTLRLRFIKALFTKSMPGTAAMFNMPRNLMYCLDNWVEKSIVG